MKRLGPLKSLRGRVAMVSTAAVATVLILVGFGALTSFESQEYSRVDDSLSKIPVPELGRALGGAMIGPGPQPGNGGPGNGNGPPGSDPGRPVLLADGEYLRLISGDEVIASLDAPKALPVPDEPGLRTLDSNGTSYRSLTRPVGQGNLLENGVSLKNAKERVDGLRDRLLLIGTAGVLLVMIFSWWLAGVALGPLGRLRDAAGRVSSTDDLSNRIDPGESPTEIEELATSINAMLARLERSSLETREALESTRRFAGDAGHEMRTPMTALMANLAAVRRNPDIEPADRIAAIEQMEHDAARMMRLLGTLQTLARGDSAAALPRERIELDSLVANALESARHRHPEIEWQLEAPEAGVETNGWPDGLRGLVDNLLENAARHGKADGKVTVTLAEDGADVLVEVDDDGPGIPADQRERVFERFERGDTTGSEGSGLGLSLVRQQARLHGGDVTVAESPAGGARFRVRLTHGSDSSGDGL